MKKILPLLGVAILFTTTGWLVTEGGNDGHYRGHRHNEERSSVIVGPPVVEVRVPVVEVRPPVVIVHLLAPRPI